MFNDTLKLDGMMFFWSLINTFKDLGRVKIGRLVVNTLLMWAAYLGSYTALAAALTVAGEPMQLVDVFGLLFGRNAADLPRCCPAVRWALRPPRRAACWLGLCCRWWPCGRRRCCPSVCAARSITPLRRPPRPGKAIESAAPGRRA